MYKVRPCTNLNEEAAGTCWAWFEGKLQGKLPLVGSPYLDMYTPVHLSPLEGRQDIAKTAKVGAARFRNRSVDFPLVSFQLMV